MLNMTRESAHTQLSALAAKGLSRKQIATMLGWGLSKTNHWLIKLGIATTARAGRPRHPAPDPEVVP